MVVTLPIAALDIGYDEDDEEEEEEEEEDGGMEEESESVVGSSDMGLSVGVMMGGEGRTGSHESAPSSSSSAPFSARSSLSTALPLTDDVVSTLDGQPIVGLLSVPSSHVGAGTEAGVGMGTGLVTLSPPYPTTTTSSLVSGWYTGIK